MRPVLQKWRHHAARLGSVVDLSLIAVLLLVLVVNLPALQRRFLPIHDTVQSFQGFHFFYSHLRQTGTFPGWTPFAPFGCAAGFWQLIHLSPASYLLMGIGRLLHSSRALLLFKLSVVLEQIVFAVGMYRLSRMLFRERTTQFVVTAAAALGIVWYSQIWWTLRLVYLAPWTLFFLLRFTQHEKGRDLWAAVVVTLLGLIGNLPYFAVLWFWLYAAAALALSCGRWRVWLAPWRREPANIAGAALALGFVALYAVLLRAALLDLDIVQTGRDQATAAASLHGFLRYGGRMDPATVLRMLLFGWPIHAQWSGFRDTSYYAGLFAVPLLGYAVLHVRDRRFLAFAGVGLLLFWLALAGAMAAVLYHLPGMRWFRHLSLIGAPIRLLLLLCAGFGLDAFLRRGRARDVLVAVVGMMFLIDFAGPATVADYARTVVAAFDGPPEVQPWWRLLLLQAYDWRAGAALAVVVSLLARPAAAQWARIRGRAAPAPEPGAGPLPRALLCGVCVLDLLLFQAAAMFTAPRPDPSWAADLDAVQTAPLHCPEYRREQAAAPRARKALRLMSGLADTKLIPIVYSFAGAAPTGSAAQPVLMPGGVRTLLQARGRAPEQDPALARVLGWNSPTFRVVTRAVRLPTAAAARQLLATAADLDRILVLQGSPGTFGTVGSRPAAAAARVLDSTADYVELQVDAAADEGAWLVWADAWHPNWTATVNGEPVPIEKAYLAFKAVPVPRGGSRVCFRFAGGWRSRVWELYNLLALATGSGLAAAALWGLRRRTDDRASAQPAGSAAEGH